MLFDSQAGHRIQGKVQSWFLVRSARTMVSNKIFNIQVTEVTYFSSRPKTTETKPDTTIKPTMTTLGTDNDSSDSYGAPASGGSIGGSGGSSGGSRKSGGNNNIYRQPLLQPIVPTTYPGYPSGFGNPSMHRPGLGGGFGGGVYGHVGLGLGGQFGGVQAVQQGVGYMPYIPGKRDVNGAMESSVQVIFRLCNIDDNEGLTWNEVEKCEVCFITCLNALNGKPLELLTHFRRSFVRTG